MKAHHAILGLALVFLALLITTQIPPDDGPTVNEKDIVSGDEGLTIILVFFAGLALFALAMGAYSNPSKK